jgi:hypothetical protein
MTFFGENDDFVRETKIVVREKNTVKVTVLQMQGQPRG